MATYKVSDYNLLALSDIADIVDNECKTKSWYAYAKPYVHAMATLETANENYYEDSGVSVCLYALANLSVWRGENARLIKAQINRHIRLALKN
jgi:hypothetical protein